MEELIRDRRHEKNPNDFKTASIIISAPDESNLFEITQTYIKTLNDNGAWDFNLSYSKGRNTIIFKYNGTIAAPDSIGKLNFNCEYNVKSNWKYTCEL